MNITPPANLSDPGVSVNYWERVQAENHSSYLARRRDWKLDTLFTRSPNAYIAETGLTIVAGSYITVENGVSTVSAVVTPSVDVKTLAEVSFRWLVALQLSFSLQVSELVYEPAKASSSTRPASDSVASATSAPTSDATKQRLSVLVGLLGAVAMAIAAFQV